MCHHCGQPFDRDRKPGFNETCATCGKDLHVCLACRFHRKDARWECAETVDFHVADKDRRNHCEWFSVDERFFTRNAGMERERTAADEARRGFDSLFG